MFFLDPLFPLFVLGTILLAHFLKGGLAPAGIALLVDFAFMLLFLGPVQSAILVGFALSGYVCLRYVGTARGRLSIMSALVLGLFIVLKQYSFLPLALRPESLPVAIGLSYVLFRLLHLIIDRGQGSGPLPGLIPHLHYALQCQSLASGPFQRYEDHEQALIAARQPEPLRDLTRMANGFIKAAVIAPLVKEFQASITPSLIGGTVSAPAGGGLMVALLLASAIVWLAFLYFNFSGYTDIVIAWARLCRIDLPENFDRPWFADSFLDFWSRWHISMTGWFRTYLFMQLMLKLGRYFPGRRLSLVLSAFSFFITFLLIGVWHGPNWPFVACGLFFGAGACVNQVAREILRARRIKLAAPLRFALTTMSAGAAFCYIAFAIMPFWLTPDQYVVLLHTVFSPVAILPFAALAAATGFAAQFLRVVTGFAEKLGQGQTLAGPMSIAARFVIVTLFVVSSSGALPDFVYKGI